MYLFEMALENNPYERPVIYGNANDKHLGLIFIKAVIRVCNNIRVKLTCSATEPILGYDSLHQTFR